MKKKNYRRKIDKFLEIPKEVYSNNPKIVITGFDELIVENFKGILEYEEFFVRISTYIGIISINGYNLNLENMSDDDIKVTGKIESFFGDSIVFTHRKEVFTCLIQRAHPPQTNQIWNGLWSNMAPRCCGCAFCT